MCFLGFAGETLEEIIVCWNSGLMLAKLADDKEITETGVLIGRQGQRSKLKRGWMAEVI